MISRLLLFFAASGGGSLPWFWPLGSVEGATAAALGDAVTVERTTHDMVAHARQVLDTPAANEHDGVFLQIMAFTGDIGGDFHTIAQAHTGNFAHGRVGLFGGHGAHLGADTAFLRGP